MKLSGIEKRLHDAVADLEIVDAHEHLPPEKEYLSFDYCGPNFFAWYICCDLGSSGMSAEFRETMRDAGHKPVEEWWPQIAPYWEHVRHGSYARAAVVTARDLYGIEEINDSTIHELAGRIRADNTPGIYERILRDRCNIRVALTCEPHTQFQNDPLLRPVPMLEPDPAWTVDGLQAHGRNENTDIRTLEDLVEAGARRLARMKSEGAVGFKTRSEMRTDPSADEARATFERIRNGDDCRNAAPLADYLFWQYLKAVAELDVPVAVHAGVWRDFRTLNPTWMIPWAMRLPETRFDLFHLGMPNAREAAFVGKNFPNVSLNLCWCYLISQQMTQRMIDELIDLVPLNKIIAFGGDYRYAVQKVYGHLVMARETVARSLARRVEEGDFSEDRAFDIAKMWFCDNPARIYKV